MMTPPLPCIQHLWGQSVPSLNMEIQPSLSKLSHLLLPQPHEEMGYLSAYASQEALFPFYTPSDPLVVDKEMFISPLHPFEWRRRAQQAHMLLQHFGTPLPAQHEHLSLARVLELSIDPHGEWMRQMASLHPQADIIGITSEELYARQARFFAAVEGHHSIHVQVCSQIHTLPFPRESVDLLCGHFLHASLPEHLWPLFLDECFRLLRPGGVLHLLECRRGESTSAAAGTLYAAYRHALEQQRSASRPSIQGTQTVEAFLPEQLPARLEKVGFVEVEQHESLLDFSAGTSFHRTLREQADDFFQLMAPLCMEQNSHLSLEGYQQVYQEMQLELLEPTFRGYWHLCIIQGMKPKRHIVPPHPSMHTGQIFSNIHNHPCSFLAMQEGSVQQRV